MLLAHLNFPANFLKNADCLKLQLHKLQTFLIDYRKHNPQPAVSIMFSAWKKQQRIRYVYIFFVKAPESRKEGGPLSKSFVGTTISCHNHVCILNSLKMLILNRKHCQPLNRIAAASAHKNFKEERLQGLDLQLKVCSLERCSPWQELIIS